MGARARVGTRPWPMHGTAVAVGAAMLCPGTRGLLDVPVEEKEPKADLEASWGSSVALALP